MTTPSEADLAQAFIAGAVTEKQECTALIEKEAKKSLEMAKKSLEMAKKASDPASQAMFSTEFTILSLVLEDLRNKPLAKFK